MKQSQTNTWCAEIWREKKTEDTRKSVHLQLTGLRAAVCLNATSNAINLFFTSAKSIDSNGSTRKKRYPHLTDNGHLDHSCTQGRHHEIPKAFKLQKPGYTNTWGNKFLRSLFTEWTADPIIHVPEKNLEKWASTI